MGHRATGTFKVSFEQLDSGDPAIGRMRVSKQITGDLEATGTAQMLSVGSTLPDSAGYVAIDQISGALHGRTGTFTLQHHGLMSRGDGTLSVVVVPDSGTGELTGLRGTFTIDNVDGAHRYTFDYDLDPA
ncbi:hypothetical protein Cs7R123_51930 [Catellatospora sp. TT07R-123]|uniref:DUF3224 domain-containing protein n=1 Tax=Catellatospora sp. TT07R-123 TaxID=2733863 RepID=UPI001B0F7FE9|nr:DUF3224 domain-containing protein [Catellatospora sp. TT07R-123]GHJ47851.1 hypothetical protein Cs7R123_51930 [Catellatospora sp. TT07R-123]